MQTARHRLVGTGGASGGPLFPLADVMLARVRIDDN
jgi:hypothetical protein